MTLYKEKKNHTLTAKDWWDLKSQLLVTPGQDADILIEQGGEQQAVIARSVHK